MTSFASYFYSDHFCVDSTSYPIMISDHFSTHSSPKMEKLYQLNQWIFAPMRYNFRQFAQVIEPLPGKNRDHLWMGAAIRIASFVLFALSLPFGLISGFLGYSISLIEHHSRPVIGQIDFSKSPAVKCQKDHLVNLTRDSPLHIRTHNLGLIPDAMSIIDDLRKPIFRAKEIMDSIINDPRQPDILFFQEAFHEEATKTLTEGIKRDYPYIVDIVAPHICGLNSGAFVASKFPINSVHFQCIDHMVGFEKLSPRGILRVQITIQNQSIFIYGVHLQALSGEYYIDSRFLQIDEIKENLSMDAKKFPDIAQILVGDFNTTLISAWGEDNRDQGEGVVHDHLHELVNDLFLQDHNRFTGERTQGKPQFLDSDNQRMKVTLPEPTASWYYGPFVNMGLLLHIATRIDGFFHKKPPSQRIKTLSEQKNTWGTPQWLSTQPANTARYDRICLMKESILDGVAEMRRIVVPPGTQSAPSDHLPVDALIWKKESHSV